MPTRRLADDAGLGVEGAVRARRAADTLRKLGADAEQSGGMIPDGVVPSALCEFMLGIGVPAGEAKAAAARIVVEIATAVQRAELARARTTAAPPLEAQQGLSSSTLL